VKIAKGYSGKPRNQDTLISLALGDRINPHRHTTGEKTVRLAKGTTAKHRWTFINKTDLYRRDVWQSVWSGKVRSGDKIETKHELFSSVWGFDLTRPKNTCDYQM